MERKFLEKLFAVVGELDEDLPAIIGCSQTGKKASVNEAIDQLNGGVMLELHALRQNTDGWLKALRETSYRQEELVLLRLDAGFSGSVFAETQEAADLVAKLCHRFKVRRLWAKSHKYRLTIISYNDIIAHCQGGWLNFWAGDGFNLWAESHRRF